MPICHQVNFLLHQQNKTVYFNWYKLITVQLVCIECTRSGPLMPFVDKWSYWKLFFKKLSLAQAWHCFANANWKTGQLTQIVKRVNLVWSRNDSFWMVNGSANFDRNLSKLILIAKRDSLFWLLNRSAYIVMLTPEFDFFLTTLVLDQGRLQTVQPVSMTSKAASYTTTRKTFRNSHLTF